MLKLIVGFVEYRPQLNVGAVSLFLITDQWVEIKVQRRMALKVVQAVESVCPLQTPIGTLLKHAKQIRI